MKLRLGPLPDDPGFWPEQGDWHKLKEPEFGRLMLLSLPVSGLMGAGMLLAWSALARAHSIEGRGTVMVTPTAILVALAALAALAVAHELTHALALPGLGLTPATTIGLWLQKLTPYVSYAGELTRNRFAAVGSMPFLVLSVVPLLVGGLSGWMPAWVVALSSVNAFLSSGDLIGTALLLAQAPRAAIVRSKGLETWWRSRPAEIATTG
jgi:hypothetical protein